MKQSKEALILGGVSIFLFAILILGGLAPRLFPEEELSPNDQYGIMISRLMDFIQASHVKDVSTEQLVDGALRGLFESIGDPFSNYLSASDMDSLRDTTDGEFGGVGLYINKIPPSSLTPADEGKLFFVEVVSPIEGTPAFKAGIVAGDFITHIEDESVRNLTIDDILDRLRGTPDTDVKITILRGGSISFDVTLTRAKIVIPTTRTAVIDESIGYLRIIQFTPHTAEKVEENLRDFVAQGVDSLIIDLRSNPGGLLDSVNKVADFFFEDGVIVSTQSRLQGESKVFEATKGAIVPQDWPIIALVDNGSASASEILAGALKDRQRGILIGETTYGKGSVQQIYPLGYFFGAPVQFGGSSNFTQKAYFKLTISRYFTPSGINIDSIGIEPNIQVAPPEYSEQELEVFKNLYDSRRIPQFASNNPDATDQTIKVFIQQLQKEGFSLTDRVLRHQINLELFRTNGISPPTVDLDWDIVLKAAVERLRTGEPLFP